MKILSITENGVSLPVSKTPPKPEPGDTIPKPFKTQFRVKGCKTCKPIKVVSVDMLPTAWPTNYR